MQKEESKNLILSLIGIAILFVAVIGISYAIFSFTSSGKTVNNLSTGSISMKYIESDTNVISITNTIPMSDEVGKVQTEYFDFTIETSISGKATIEYEIRAEKLDVFPYEEISDSDIKLYLEKEQNSRYVSVMEPTGYTINSESVLKDLEVNNNTMLLYQGSFVNNYSNLKKFLDNFRLRMWVSDKYNTTASSKSFKIRVNVYSGVARNN